LLTLERGGSASPKHVAQPSRSRPPGREPSPCHSNVRTASTPRGARPCAAQIRSGATGLRHSPSAIGAHPLGRRIARQSNGRGHRDRKAERHVCCAPAIDSRRRTSRSEIGLDDPEPSIGRARASISICGPTAQMERSGPHAGVSRRPSAVPDIDPRAAVIQGLAIARESIVH
jgi:hypothetical protein